MLLQDTSFYGLESRWQIIRIFVDCISNYRKVTRKEDDPQSDDLESSNKQRKKVSNQTAGAARWDDFERWRKENGGKTSSDTTTDSAREHKADDNAQNDVELHALFSPEVLIPESVLKQFKGTQEAAIIDVVL